MNAQTNIKLKLQLFPIDDDTRRALEMVSGKETNVNSFNVEEIFAIWAVFRTIKEVFVLIHSQDKHNPYLELTLSTRKKISSVLEHLYRKWGNSSIASGELMLFPYTAHRENLVSYQRWTRDSIVSASDVYASIGSPPVFRLRFILIFFLNLMHPIF